MLCLPGGVGVDVHSRVDIRVSQQLLHILGGRAVGEKIAGERVPLWHNRIIQHLGPCSP